MVRLLIVPMLACLLVGSAAQAEDLKLEVTEVGSSVDLSRGGARFLTLVVEIRAPTSSRLRGVQPLRDDFQVLAGKSTLPCRWLRGGTAPDEPASLRFTLGFSMPPRQVRRVSLRANLPRLDSGEQIEVRLSDLQTGGAEQERKGDGWALTVDLFRLQDYEAPSLPPSGKFFSKGGPVDARVFRKQTPSEAAPAQAVRLSFHSRTVSLYDSMLDVSGTLQVAGGPATPLLSALVKRDPSRAVEKPLYGPFVRADFYFAVPPKGRATGVILSFHRRAPDAAAQPVVIRNLPVPGS